MPRDLPARSYQTSAVADDPRLTQIRRSLEILAGDGPNRAERIQMVFSLPYEKGKGD